MVDEGVCRKPGLRCLDSHRAGGRPWLAAVKILAVTALSMTVANCSAPRTVSNGRGVDPRYGVAASPRVIEEGQPVPKGGGREMVGKPYQIAGRTYVPRENPAGYSRTGLASWYGSAFHGRLTANGEIFDRESVAAAHPTMPLPSYARVTNLDNRRSMIVRVNDRGPYHADRVIDVSEQVAEALEFRRAGTARVRVDYVGRASLRGSDDRKLLATLRTDGRAAPFSGAPVMVAEAEPIPRRQSFASQAERRGDGLVEPTAAPAADSAPMRVAGGAPRPPERPFDLGTIPNAATPVPVAALAPTPPGRPIMAGLYFAEPPSGSPAFKKSDPFQTLKPQRFVALKANR